MIFLSLIFLQVMQIFNGVKSCIVLAKALLY